VRDWERRLENEREVRGTMSGEERVVLAALTKCRKLFPMTMNMKERMRERLFLKNRNISDVT
jgi:hypothetical protein